MDSRGASAVRGPIERSKATHPSLIDADHVVADLYNTMNVPSVVWIDEAGEIVRPAENPGAQLSFNLRKLARMREAYFDAIRDWVGKGRESEHALSADAARARMPAFTEQIALAHANFHLGRHLHEQGKKAEAMTFLREATELNPDSWNFFRQMKNLEHILGSAGFEMASRVRAHRKSGKDYYALPGIASLERIARE